MTLGPVVSSSRLSEDEVVGPEDLAVGPGSDGVHGAGLEVDKDSSWDVLAAGGFVVVNVDAFKLEVGVSVVSTGRVDAMLVGNDFPELESGNKSLTSRSKPS